MAEHEQVDISLLKSDAQTKSQARIEHILSNLLKLASGDFNLEELETIEYDSIDAIDRGIVMLSEHLEAARIEHEKHLKEKENLLKEIHHRVKNNLQIISSLLNLQAQYTKNDEAYGALKQSQFRINSMSTIHEMLYKSKDISLVNYKDYLKKITTLLVESIPVKKGNITIEVLAPDVFIALDTAVTLGLLVNEIVTNSLIHGIKEKGTIYLHFFKNENGEVLLKIGDNGIGFDQKKRFHSLGLQLIEILTNQLDGSWTREINNGTHYTFVFTNERFKL